MQNSNEVILTQQQLYDARIMPKDVLNINVYCPQEPSAVAMFNLAISGQSISANSNTQSYLSSQMVLQTYIVSNDGYIDFPVLGKLYVMGMTKTELENAIKTQIHSKYLKEEPLVVVNMANYKITVLGEVQSPGVYTVQNGKINLMEALAMAKDLTIYGRRDSVKIIREDQNGNRQIQVMNLNDANIVNSPYYQLQQNDIVYVTPNKTKAKNSGIGSETSLWFSATSILISLASLMYNILK